MLAISRSRRFHLPAVELPPDEWGSTRDNVFTNWRPGIAWILALVEISEKHESQFKFLYGPFVITVERKGNFNDAAHAISEILAEG